MNELDETRSVVFEQADRIDTQRKKLDFILDAIAHCPSEFTVSTNGTYGLFCVIREISGTLREVEYVLRGRGAAGAIKSEAA